MEFGLKGKMEATYKELSAIRSGFKVSNLPAELTGMKDVSLLQYLSAKYKEGCDSNGNFDMGYLYHELGINPKTMTVEALLTLDQDSRWLVPEIFRDAIRKGIRTSPIYNALIAASEDVAQPQVNLPYIDMSDAEPQPVGQGGTIPKGSISYGNKTVNVSKKGIGIDITYETIKYTNINLLSIYLQDVGIKLGQLISKDAVLTLINGDQAGGSESAPTIGVGNTGTGLLYSDLIVPWIRGSQLGRLYNVIVGGEEMIRKILLLQEFKEKQAGTPQQTLVLNTVLPSQSNAYVSVYVPNNQAIVLDPRFALVQLTADPLTVEAEKIISKQIQGTYATITTGFANVFRDARVILDQSLERIPGTQNDFPSYMDLVV